MSHARAETEEYLTTAEAGRLCEPPLTPAGIRAAVAAGRLRVATRTHTGIRLYRRQDVEKFQELRRKAGTSPPEPNAA
jgi:hypothetical protein